MAKSPVCLMFEDLRSVEYIRSGFTSGLGVPGISTSRPPRGGLKEGSAVKRFSITLVLADSALGAADPHAAKVYVGYADSRGEGSLPSPWDGDPGVVFRGSGPPYDAGAIRIVNPSARTLTVNDVSVDIGSVHYDLWAFYPILVPGKGSLILTQTVQYDFDTSEPGGNETCIPTGEIPVVKVVIGRKHLQTKVFRDVGQVLNTGGIDSGTCQGGSEGHAWQRVLPRGR